jgi:CBS domain-containing protein
MPVVKDIMTTDLVTFAPETDVVKAAQILLDRHINGAPVVDGSGRLVGILCQSDLVAQQKKIPVPTLFTLLDGVFQLTSKKQIEKELGKIAALTVAESMTPDPVTVSPDTAIETVAALMVDSSYHTLPVVENDRLVGIIGKEDVLRTLLPKEEEK